MFNVKEDPKNSTIYLQLSSIKDMSKRAIRQGFYFIGKDLRQDAMQSILKGPKTGRVYTIYRKNSKRKHQSSAPGQAPANLTGNLRRSIIFEVRGSTQLEFGVSQSSTQGQGGPRNTTAEYGKFLELGTSKMEPRPFLKPAVNKNTANAVQHFEAQIKKDLEGIR